MRIQKSECRIAYYLHNLFIIHLNAELLTIDWFIYYWIEGRIAYYQFFLLFTWMQNCLYNIILFIFDSYSELLTIYFLFIVIHLNAELVTISLFNYLLLTQMQNCLLYMSLLFTWMQKCLLFIYLFIFHQNADLLT